LLPAQSIDGVITKRAPLAPSGCPSAIAPPLPLTCSASSASPRLRVHASNLSGKGFIDFDAVELVEAPSDLR
jgi:hypothetical protein